MSGAIIDFDEELSRHGQIFGREDVLAQIRSWFFGDEPLSRGWVLLTGSPGVGKSAIIAEVLKTLLEPTAPRHLIRRGIEGWDRPDVVVQNLCAQIERLYPERRNPDLPSEVRLGDLLKRVSNNVLVPPFKSCVQKRLILVLDGLDEVADDGSGENPLHRFLPRALPPGVVILCASRPMYTHLNWISRYNVVRPIDLDSGAWLASNEAACRAFWEHQRMQFCPPLDPTFVDEAVQRAGGNLLHAILLRDWLKIQPLNRRVATNIPKGLFEFLQQIWSELHQLDGARCALVLEGLGVACTAREALPGYLFREILGWEASGDSEAFLHAARPFLLEEPAHWHDGDMAYRPYHECFREFLAKKLGEPKIREHHRRLADTLAPWPPREHSALRRGYALRHAIAHRLEAGDVPGAQRLCTDIGYLQAKCRKIGVTAIEQDLEATIHASDEDTALDLRMILTTVSAEVNQLRVDPISLPALLYNRLRCAGWPADRIERALSFPDGPPPLRLMHAVRLGPTLLRSFSGHTKPVVACVAMPDGSRVLSASADRTLRLWSAKSGECIAVLSGHTGDLTACAVLPEGREAISTSTDATVRVWDLIERLPTATLDNEDRWSTACAVSPDGQHIVIGSDDGSIRIWDRASLRRISTLRGHTDYVTACVVTADGKHVVSGSRDESVRVWELSSGACVHTLRRFESLEPRGIEEQRWVTALALMPTGGHVIVASGDGSLAQWELTSGRCVTTFSPGDIRIDACAITRDGLHLFCGLKSGEILVWDLVTSRRIDCLKAHTDAVSACAVMPNGKRVISASYDQSLKLWELGAPASMAIKEEHTAPIAACAVTPDGGTAVSASEDRTLKVWNLATGECRATLEGHEDLVTACAISVDGLRVVSGARDGSLRVWSVPTREPLFIRKVHSKRVSGCAVTQRGEILSASYDGTLRRWDPSTSTDGAVFGSHADLEGFAATPDGAHVLSVSRNGTAKLWNLTTGKCLPLLVGPGAGFLCCAVTSDGRRAVLARESGALEMYDFHSRRCMSAVRGHEKRIFGCALSPDGERVVSASEDETLKVWSFETGTLLGTLHGVRLFRCAAMTNEWICAGDEEGNLWMLASGAATPQGRTRPKSPGRPPRAKSRGRGAVASIESAILDQEATEAGGRRPKTRLAIDSKPISPGKRSPMVPLALLWDALARLHPYEEEIRRFIAQVGLDVRTIPMKGSIMDMWCAVVNDAYRHGRLQDVVQCAQKSDPNDAELAAAARALGFK